MAWRHEDGVAAAVRLAVTDTRLRKERRGADCSSASSRGRSRGERKRGHDGDGAPFIGDAVGVGDGS
jgi:hypothetical protein